MSPSARNSGAFSASASAEPNTPAIAASTIPQMAPPAMRPLANNTPGPDSTSAIDCCRACARRSMSQRTTPAEARINHVAQLVWRGLHTVLARGPAFRHDVDADDLIAGVVHRIAGGDAEARHRFGQDLDRRATSARRWCHRLGAEGGMGFGD